VVVLGIAAFILSAATLGAMTLLISIERKRELPGFHIF
jgi:hypothetical protein